MDTEKEREVTEITDTTTPDDVRARTERAEADGPEKPTTEEQETF